MSLSSKRVAVQRVSSSYISSVVAHHQPAGLFTVNLKLYGGMAPISKLYTCLTLAT
jgi:hypothetical protein